MPIKSYAQWAEDVYLYRALKDVPSEIGFYIDVGANDPDFDSVTKLFYELGWRGINVEPSPEWFETIAKARPRDINIRAAVSNASGEVMFHDNPGGQLGTLVEEFADRHEKEGLKRRSYSVEMMTLSQICEAHAPKDIHFLKVDVEGHEGKVLQGMDFSRFRPWLLAIEATEPLRVDVPTYEEWDQHVRDAGYIFAYTDVLNRYYVAEEHADLVPFISTPADDYVRLGNVADLGHVKATLRLLEPHAVEGFAKRRFGSDRDGGSVLIDDFRGIDKVLSVGSGKSGSLRSSLAEKPLGFHVIDDRHAGVATLLDQHDRGDPRPNIVLCTDIGGETWDFLNAASNDELRRFAQIVCEMHNLESLSDISWNRKITRVFTRLVEAYSVVHVHANNYGGTAMIHGITVPRVLRVTFASKEIYSFSETRELFPGGLDLACNPDHPDIYLGCFRF